KFYIEVGPAGFAQGTGAVDSSLTTSYTASGLAGGMWWDVYIQADCSGSNNGFSAWSGPYNFRTFQTAPYAENFDSTGFTPNLYWSKAEGLIGNPTTFTSNYSGWYEDGWLNNGWNGSARVNINNWSGDVDEWFFTEEIDLGTSNNWEVYFDAALTAAYSSALGTLEADDTLKVVVSTDAGLTWNDSNTILVIDQSSNLSNISQSFAASLAGYSGIIKIGFYTESTVANTSGLDLFIDNFEVRVPQACPAASGIHGKNITANTLTIGWNSSPSTSSYMVEFGPSGFVQGTGTSLSSITTDSVNVSGLNPVTQYDFYVISICGTDTTVSGPTTVLTGCPAVHSTPYFENFDILNAGSPPANGEWINCWNSDNFTGYQFRWEAGDGAYPWASTGPSADHTSGTGMYMFAESGNPGAKTNLVAGPFDLSTLQQPMISFWYHMYGFDMGWLHVDISKDGVNWDEGTYTLAKEQHSSQTDPWSEAKLALSQYVNDTIYVRFRAVKEAGYNGDMAIDDFSIGEASGCISPSGLSASNLTSTSADLVWGSYSTPSSIEWGPQGFVQGTGIGNLVTGINGTSLPISGLTPNTAYDFYVKDTCNLNSWVGPMTFYSACTGPLSGTYTIGGAPGATNFENFGLAIQALSNCGVSSAVTFNLMGINDTGNYIIPEIAGASASNTIEFIGTGNDYIYGTSSFNYTMHFDGASYITLRGIVIKNSASPISLWMNNNTHHVSIDSCELHGMTGATFNSSVIAATNVATSLTSIGNNANNISITNNDIYNAYQSISMYGDADNRNSNLNISGNTFNGVDQRGVRVHGYDTVAINNNSMLNVASQWGGTGITLFYCDELQINANNISLEGTVLEISNSNTASNASTEIVNNMFVGKGQYARTVYFTNVNNVDFFHNSVSGGEDALYITAYLSANNYDIRNNILHSPTGRAYYKSATAADTNYVIDYNLFYSGGSTLASDGGLHTDLAAWKSSAPSFNMNSIEGDPIFTSVDDLHILGTLPNDVADNSLNIATDIDGD
ncbi:MAG: hypothetical protein N4A46_11365, partial [Schleiferiaceae bacterium]|nr:hypothetical protein [Schleiferiaceae bacterium]